jgi:excinuclease ABC subunit C
VFFFRNFQNWGNRAYFPKADRSMSADEVLASFISLLGVALRVINEVLALAPLRLVDLDAVLDPARQVHQPQRGERKNLVDYAQRNAKEALGRRLADTASQGKLLTALGQAFVMKPVGPATIMPPTAAVPEMCELS